MKGRQKAPRTSAKSGNSEDKPRKLSKTHQKDMFSSFAKVPPNSKKRNPKNFRTAPQNPKNTGISKFDRLIQHVERTRAEEIQEVSGQDTGNTNAISYYLRRFGRLLI